MIAREPDVDRHRTLLERAEKRVLDGYPVIPVYFYADKQLVKPYVHEFRANIMDHDYSKHFRVERNSN